MKAFQNLSLPQGLPIIGGIIPMAGYILQEVCGITETKKDE